MVGSDSLIVRPAVQSDDDAIWRVIEPVFRAGETYALPREISRADALAYWRRPAHAAFVAEDAERIAAPTTCAPIRSRVKAILPIALISLRQTPAAAGWHGPCARIPSNRRASAASAPCSLILSFPPTRRPYGCGRAAASPSCGPCPERSCTRPVDRSTPT